jgi:hypothetical protein
VAGAKQCGPTKRFSNPAMKDGEIEVRQLFALDDLGERSDRALSRDGDRAEKVIEENYEIHLPWIL